MWLVTFKHTHKCLSYILGIAADGREMLAMTTGPDHCAFDESVLVDAIVDYFTGIEWKDKTLTDFHQFIQVCRTNSKK